VEASISVTATITDRFTNVLRNANRFFSSYNRKLMEEGRAHATRQAFEAAQFVYTLYEPVAYKRTYQLLEGLGVTVAGKWPRVTLSIFDTARNRDGRGGEQGFPYPSVVEFGQGMSARDPQDVADRVAQALHGSDRVIPVVFMGEYGWHEMPPRPFMTIAAVAVGNWYYRKGAGRMTKAWIRSANEPRKKVVRIMGR